MSQGLVFRAPLSEGLGFRVLVRVPLRVWAWLLRFITGLSCCRTVESIWFKAWWVGFRRLK